MMVANTLRGTRHMAHAHSHARGAWGPGHEARRRATVIKER